MSVRPRRLTVWAAVGLAALVVAIVVTIAARARPSLSPRILDVEIHASSGTMARLFWSDDSQFADSHSIRVPLRPAAEGFQHLRFPLPSQGARWIRFNPSDAPGEMLIGKVQLLDSQGQVIGALDPASLKSAAEIDSISRQGDVTRVVTTTGARDPSLVASLACLERPAPLSGLSQVTPTTLALVSGAVIALLIACLVVLGRAIFASDPDPTASAKDSRTAIGSALLWMAVLFLVVFSARLFLMRANPVTVPFWDQWDAEARQLYVPFNDCDLSWSHMFSLHNEHRVFFTRLLALDLLMMNGQWDPRLEQVVNAAMDAFTAVVIVAMFWLPNQRRRLDLLVFVGALTFAVPFAWENTLSGFQSAFYFLLMFSVLALWLTTRYRAGSIPWWLGWTCAASALFTSAGGVFATLAIVGVVGLKLANDRSEWRESLITLPVAAAVIGLGIAMASPPVPWHESLKAHTALEFAGALVNNLAWPWVDRPQLTAAIMWLPVVLLLVTAALRRARTTEVERLILGLSVWVVLNDAAVAYGRGAGSPLPQTRYMDFLSLGLVANAVALVVLLDRSGSGRMARRVAMGGLAAWLVFAAVGVDRLTQQTHAELGTWRQFYAAHATNVRRFIITGELAEFTSMRPLIDIPYPDAKSLAITLRDPYVRRILPAGVREPVHLEPRAVTNDAFVPDGSPVKAHDPLQRTWGSYSERGRGAEGRFDSQPVGACRWGQRLSFPVSGYLGLPDQYLALKDLSSGRDLAIVPPTVPREHWLDVIVPCPDRPFSITAIDATGESWFAFREPVEVGWGSLAAERLIRWSRELLLTALALAGLAARRF